MRNVLMLIGRITKEVELRTNGDKSICRIPIAVQNGKDDTTFIEVTAFGNTANTVNQYCKKGDLIAIKGMVKNNNWTDDKGNKHYDYSFIANQVTFLSTKSKEINENNQNTNKDPFEDFGEQIQITDDLLD